MLRVPGLADRATVVNELSLPLALALKHIDETCLARLLQRVSGRLTREMRERFPDDGVENVTLEVDPPTGRAREVRVGIVGPTAGKRAALLDHARMLWDRKMEALDA